VRTLIAVTVTFQLVGVAVAVWAGYRLTNFIAVGEEGRASIRQAWRIRWGWRRLARVLNLCVTDPTPRFKLWIRRYADPASDRPRVVVPRLWLKADEFGVVVRTRTLPKVGRLEWEAALEHLADAWLCTRVAVTRAEPGRLVVRAVRRDPLAVPTSWTPTGVAPSAEDFKAWPLGLDEYAEQVRVRLANVAGVTVAGIPGSGKTSLINGFLARYAPSPLVQFALLDGKDAGDFDDAAPRFFADVGDDLAEANELLRRLVDLRRRRAEVIRQPVTQGGLGRKNFWSVGPTESWPLVVTVVDECHGYLQTVKDGGNAELKKRNSLANQNALLLEDLAKKGRSLGFLTILATQKATGDSIPTAIRDVCAVAASFAQTTSAASVAALGEAIREWPASDPMLLQGPDYVGVASMRVEGRLGFTRVRTPLVDDDDVARVCAASAQLTRDPAALLPRRLAAVPEGADNAAESA